MKILELSQSVSWEYKNNLEGFGDFVFTSLHVPEELNKDFATKAKELCDFLYSKNLKIIADVSPRTLKAFDSDSFYTLAQQLHLYALRVDFGLSSEEIAKLAKTMPVAINASTMRTEDAAKIAEGAKKLLAIHNFYPRPETGLDNEQFVRKTKALQSLGYEVFAFIPGNKDLRGPIHAGLPTLEEHRKLTPGTAYQILCAQEACDGVIIGDMGISKEESARIKAFQQNKTISLHCNLLPQYKNIAQRIFTCREDSPAGLIRVKESRTYATAGFQTKPANCINRNRGSITMDNTLYARYSGEIMITRADYPKNDKVNVIGTIEEESIPLLDCIENGQGFSLINKE